MGYIAGLAREQLILFPESLDDYIALDNPVRFIDAWVDSLNLAGLGFSDTVPARRLGRACGETQHLLE